MPTITVDVNAVSGDTTSFNVNASTILSNASDGDTGSTFFNTVANKTLTFALEDISDLGISFSSLNSLTPIVTAAAGGKGAMSFSIEIVSSDAVVTILEDTGGSSGTQTEFEGEVADLTGYATNHFNDLSIRYTTTGGTQPVVSGVKATLDYTAAAAVAPPPYLKLEHGRYKVSKGRLKVV